MFAAGYNNAYEFIQVPGYVVYAEAISRAFKKLVKDICMSRTYQHSTKATPSNEADTRNFARGSIRRIRAETMLDCITQVTETKDKFPGLPVGARAVQIADGSRSTYFLTTFGRATRETVCSCEVKLEPTLSQSLHLLNGETTTQRIAAGNLIGRRLAEKKAPQEVLEVRGADLLLAFDDELDVDG